MNEHDFLSIFCLHDYSRNSTKLQQKSISECKKRGSQWPISVPSPPSIRMNAAIRSSHKRLLSLRASELASGIILPKLKDGGVLCFLLLTGSAEVSKRGPTMHQLCREEDKSEIELLLPQFEKNPDDSLSGQIEMKCRFFSRAANRILFGRKWSD